MFKSLKNFNLDLDKFLAAPGLAWQAASKNTEVKLELLTDTDVLLIVEKEIRGRISRNSLIYNS